MTSISRKQTDTGPTKSICLHSVLSSSLTLASGVTSLTCAGEGLLSVHGPPLPSAKETWLPISGPGNLYPKELWEGPGHTCRNGRFLCERKEGRAVRAKE